jgi:predicted phosphodiesterase
MTHGHLGLAPAGDHARLVRHFATFKPDIVIYGHTHIAHLESCEGATVFNPGAAGRAGFNRARSVGLITRHAPDQPVRLEHLALS